MTEFLPVVMALTRIIDYGEYYYIEYSNAKYIIRKDHLWHDLRNVISTIPCPYVYDFLKIVSIRLRINYSDAVKLVKCYPW
jgi:hypothetical protein